MTAFFSYSRSVLMSQLFNDAHCKAEGPGMQNHVNNVTGRSTEGRVRIDRLFVWVCQRSTVCEHCYS